MKTFEFRPIFTVTIDEDGAEETTIADIEMAMQVFIQFAIIDLPNGATMKVNELVELGQVAEVNNEEEPSLVVHCMSLKADVTMKDDTMYFNGVDDNLLQGELYDFFLRGSRFDQVNLWNIFKYDIWGDPEIKYNKDGLPKVENIKQRFFGKGFFVYNINYKAIPEVIKDQIQDEGYPANTIAIVCRKTQAFILYFPDKKQYWTMAGRDDCQGSLNACIKFLNENL